MRFEKLNRTHSTPNSGELSYATYLKNVDFALRLFTQVTSLGVTQFDMERTVLEISNTYTRSHRHRAHSGSPWGHKCKLGGRGGRRNFGFGRHKLKLLGERGRLPLLTRASW